MAIIILAIIILGFYMVSLPNNFPNKFTLYNIHKVIGIVILCLSIIRIIFRLSSDVPPLPIKLTWPLKTIYKFTHFGLYLLLVLTPLSGYVMSSASGKEINFFIFKLPLLVHQNLDIALIAKSLHGIFVYSLITLVLLHWLATIKHLIIDKQNLFKRII